jgi:hypothetical protein
MTHREALLSLQLMAEERIGGPQRRAILEQVERENQAAEAAANAIKAIERGSP